MLARSCFFDWVEVFDVVLENFRVGTLQKLGIDYDKAAPAPGHRLLLGTGFGQTGPYRGPCGAGPHRPGGERHDQRYR